MACPKHCKGCPAFHNAGHPEKSNLAKTYNAWCIEHSKPAAKAYGICITNGSKQQLTKEAI